MRRARFPTFALGAMLLASTAACAADADDPPGELHGSAAVAVVDESGAPMGSVLFPVSCSAEASERMRLGLALLHHMTYLEAEDVFREAAALDADCGIARWGIAMTFLHPLWPDVPTPARLDQGWELLQGAREAGLPTAREVAYVSALESYYRDARGRPEGARLAAYADAWQEVRADHPDDPEAALFSALALIAVAQSAPTATGLRTTAGELAESVLSAIPDHPGAHHYVIHAFDVPALADRALSVARRYGEVAPENSHALHMTSHIFTRRGLWEESIEYNARAAAAAGSLDGDVTMNALHAIDYLVYAHLQRGEDDMAQQVLETMRAVEGSIEDHAASVYAFAAVEARIALERRDWASAARVRVREPERLAWDRYPHLEAMQVFARALGQAHTGDTESARASAARLAELAAAASELPEAYDWGTQVRVQELGARAWIAYAEDDDDEALTLMREAAELEATTDKNPVTPSAVLPAGELLGDMLRAFDRQAEALMAYTAALDRSWNRFNSLYGAALAAEGMGDEGLAADYYRHLLNVASASATRRAPLERARAAVS